jgi:hypothetical protein
MKIQLGTIDLRCSAGRYVMRDRTLARLGPKDSMFAIWDPRARDHLQHTTFTITLHTSDIAFTPVA